MFKSLHVALAVGLSALATSARAGVYTDDLSKCLVRSTSSAEQGMLAVWVFSAMSQHPAMKSYSNITPAQVNDVTDRAGKLFQRLLTVDCRKETVAGLKYEGGAAMAGAFEVLGQVAFRTLMNEPAVAGSIQSLTTHVDMAKIKELGVEAGTDP